MKTMYTCKLICTFKNMHAQFNSCTLHVYIFYNDLFLKNNVYLYVFSGFLFFYTLVIGILEILKLFTTEVKNIITKIVRK